MFKHQIHIQKQFTQQQIQKSLILKQKEIQNNLNFHKHQIQLQNQFNQRHIILRLMMYARKGTKSTQKRKGTKSYMLGVQIKVKPDQP